jgi:alpha-tubulin suppressor-like RCC1 family protein
MKVKLPVTAVSIGTTAAHACVASSSDDVWCWGYNGSGELGTGVVTELDGIATPVKVLPYCSR